MCWADDICTRFLKNERVAGKIFEENSLILTILTIFLQTRGISPPPPPVSLEMVKLLFRGF
jgi:hypothetical protein